MRIVAINITHDSSICSLNDGNVEFFCKEERLSRIKKDNFPFKCLELYKSLNFGKIDHFLYCTPSNNEHSLEHFWKIYIKKMFDVEMENFSHLLHHSCHASIAYYNSNFKKALIFVVDRNGSLFFIDGESVARECESVFLCENDKEIFPIYKCFRYLPNFGDLKEKINDNLKKYYPECDTICNSDLGVVTVYEAATTLIGQNVLENGKTMGLSSYGDDLKQPLFINNVPISSLFSYISGSEIISFFGEEKKSWPNYNVIIDKNNFKYYANKAKQVQLETQNVISNLIKKYTEKTNIKNICIVGGYGLNVVANNFYIKNFPHLNFYFEPVSDDTGISVGACMLKYKMETKKRPNYLKDNFYHYYDHLEKISLGKKSSLEEIVQLLIQQKSVAIFENEPESGPRALGHRSILFDARNKNSKNIVNLIKKREWYRPFAGIILDTEFDKYFYNLNIKDSPYMTINFECLPGVKEFVPGIIHVDNTCRIQTINQGFVYDLLKCFFEKTGCPMILNTSFNIAGEPLIQTKKQAIDMLNQTELDYVYFVDENKLVSKNFYY
jgi:carbamoyltransferase